jgi:hypothetical protein
MDGYTQWMINKTREYIVRVRKLKPGDVQFHLWRKGGGLYEAKFDYGRVSTGSLHHAIYGAIANAIQAIEVQGVGGTV